MARYSYGKCEKCGAELTCDDMGWCDPCVRKMFDKIDPTGELRKKAGENLRYWREHPHTGEVKPEDFEDEV
jgi:molybdopterin/thiamine biosynthesis adenylyltransferase